MFSLCLKSSKNSSHRETTRWLTGHSATSTHSLSTRSSPQPAPLTAPGRHSRSPCSPLLEKAKRAWRPLHTLLPSAWKCVPPRPHRSFHVRQVSARATISKVHLQHVFKTAFNGRRKGCLSCAPGADPQLQDAPDPRPPPPSPARGPSVAEGSSAPKKQAASQPGAARLSQSQRSHHTPSTHPQGQPAALQQGPRSSPCTKASSPAPRRLRSRHAGGPRLDGVLLPARAVGRSSAHSRRAGACAGGSHREVYLIRVKTGQFGFVLPRRTGVSALLIHRLNTDTYFSISPQFKKSR